ncbi:hypothetical protein IBK_1195 [Dehalococcoides mccartyi IBARAKI]|nr:hypothetical protein IBK_1195 [Dehalococcoides mccartyi IBARAKI]
MEAPESSSKKRLTPWMVYITQMFGGTQAFNSHNGETPLNRYKCTVRQICLILGGNRMGIKVLVIIKKGFW